MKRAAANILPEGLEELKELAIHQAQRISDLEQLLRFKSEELRLAMVKKYGAKNEKLSLQQLLLLDQEPGVTEAEVQSEDAQSPPQPPRKKRNPKPGRVELPPHLERIEEEIACPPEQCVCGQCGAQTQLIGFEIAEVLDLKPVEYFVRVIKREKRACPHCPESGVTCAPTPPRILEKGKLSDDFIIDVLIKKYGLHQPLFRQSAFLERDAGVFIAPSTLGYGLMKAGELCAALSRAMKADLFAGGYIQADETPVGVQSPQTRGRNHQAYAFEYSRPHGPVIFDFQMGRGREGPLEFLRGFAGQLQCDAYAGYNAVENEAIERIGCMTHLRRNFHDAHKLAPEDPLPLEILKTIGSLYQIESQARDAGMNARERLALRQEQSVPLMAGLKTRILEIRQEILPAGALGKACDYALNQWERVERYLRHGHVEIDNNWCENAIRPLALGRRNWLHIGSEGAGPKIAGIISILETCRRLEINVREYLKDVLPGLANRKQSELAELTPMAWKTRQTRA
jgi:transposase